MPDAVKTACDLTCEHLARIAVQTCARVTLLERRAPRESDFSDDFGDFIRLEKLCDELRTLRTPALSRNKRARQIIEELREGLPAWVKGNE
jgi:hypothetical protein